MPMPAHLCGLLVPQHAGQLADHSVVTCPQVKCKARAAWAAQHHVRQGAGTLAAAAAGLIADPASLSAISSAPAAVSRSIGVAALATTSSAAAAAAAATGRLPYKGQRHLGCTTQLRRCCLGLGLCGNTHQVLLPLLQACCCRSSLGTAGSRWGAPD